tara:strand:+ start:2080 stop:2553 length:474 start_codon:yes stop_codon:yes gene_type:complete
METKLSKKERLLKELKDLENDNLEEPEDLGIQRGKGDDDEVEKKETITKAKKPRTEAQMKAFEKARENARLNAEKRKAEREAKALEERKIVEDKLVKKAIALKKKQIKKAAVLDEISDDETPMVEIEKIVKQLPAKKGKGIVELPSVEKKPNPYIFF